MLLSLEECKEVHARGNRWIHWNRVVIRRWNTLECGKGMQSDLARAVYVCAKARTR